MLLRIGWTFFGVEVCIALAFGFIFWYLWSHSAMNRGTARKALAGYALGSIVCLALSLLLPL
jgi:hypothetical protein